MKYYKTIQKIQLSPDAVQRASDFAAAVTPSTDYKDSHQASTSKVSRDHFISKLGEEAAYAILSGYVPVTQPDYAIYHGKAKSWTHDLFINGTGIAVKTQSRSSAKHFGLSWTFQCGPQRRDTVLDDPEAWVVFVAYDDAAPHICFVYPPYQIKDLVFGDPKLPRLKGHKKVVYATTLPIHANRKRT